MLILASRSPRRAELLRQAGIDFTARPVDVDESRLPGENPEDFVRRVAELKSLAAGADDDNIVLGADTVVVIDGRILGKPAGDGEAASMLECLSGRKHEVITGICMRRGDEIKRDWVVSLVWFASLSAREIAKYVATGEGRDKAGAYAIQGLASRFIDRIDGSYTNVVGLPVARVYSLLKEMSVEQICHNA